MERIALTDGSGKWFDREKAELFSQKADWNGNNHISRATGKTHSHESLYKTASGVYILRKYSDFQGSTEEYILISMNEAATWFAKQGFEKGDHPDELESLIAELEI